MPWPSSHTSWRLFNTNHEFKGLLQGWLKIPKLSHNDETFLIGEGEITAPDHEILALDGLHIITMSNHLVEKGD